MHQNILRFPIMGLVFFFAIGKMNGFSQTTKNIPAAAKVVYGDVIESFSAEQISWLTDQLDRSKIQQRNRTASETIPLLSSVSLMTKFTPSLKKDDFSNPQSINPLKYNIDFFKTEDQFFRIDGTDYVLFVAGKQ